ncbi:helix-turn-helix domain-containing protein [Microbulbifer sp. 2201CG32-9]|uniref:helix-turn-helix domain-containing protein n=1 Tax=Microbulbifer sp. 2201CG32-9 TaxID=3232309 RepID=UPI00345C3427
MYHYKNCGLPNIFLENGYTKRETAYGEAVAIHDLKGLHKAISLYLVGKAGTLSAREIRFLRCEMDMSQKCLASLLGVKEITVRKWESGDNKINGSSDILLRICYLQFIEESSQVKALVERLNALDRSDQEKRLKLSKNDRWNVAILGSDCA